MTTKRIKSLFRHRKALWSLCREHSYFLDRPDSTNFGSVTKEEAKGLRHAVEIANQFSGPMIEVGTLFGHTALIIAGYKSQDKKLFTIDNYSWNPFHLSPEAHREFTLNSLLLATEQHQVEVVDGSSDEFFKNYSGESPSLVFLDGAHDYRSVKSEIDFAKSLGTRVIAGHDYKIDHQDVMRAVDEQFEKITLFESLWVATAGDRG